MNYCFPCLQSQRRKKTNRNHGESAVHSFTESRAPETKKQKPTAAHENKKEENKQVENKNINAQTFTFRELASATKNFRQECLLGEGGFGRVYKGTLQSTGQVVAVKQLDRTGLHGSKEFLVEVLMLSLLHHPNLVNLIGYCADGDQRLLVYEFMPEGSVEDHLLDKTEEQKPLDWLTRIKIALGAAQGLEYLHDKANPPVIYHDLKASNILLDENLVPKLSDFGLAKLGPLGDKIHVSSRVMGTYGYCAPEYARTGELTMKSDVYSFGVVLLELITGRRVIDNTRPVEEQNLIAWAQPIFRDPKRFPDMADPLLKKQFSERSLNQAVAIAAMCLQEEPSTRPLISDVVTTLSFLSTDTETIPLPCPDPIPSSLEKYTNVIENDQKQRSCYQEDEYSGTDEDEDYSDSEDEESKEIQDENSATIANEDSSNHPEICSSGNQNKENENKGNKDERQTYGRESTKYSSKSCRKNSRRRSMDKSVSSISATSKSSQDGNASFGNVSSQESNDESIISSDRSSKESGDFGISSHKNTKKLQNSSTQKSREADGSDYLSDKKRVNKSVSLMKQKSNPKSQDGSVSSGRRSIKLKDRTVSSRRKSIKKPPYENSHNSNLQGITDHESVISSQNSIRKSPDETQTGTETSQAATAAEDPRNEVTLLHP